MISLVDEVLTASKSPILEKGNAHEDGENEKDLLIDGSAGEWPVAAPIGVAAGFQFKAQRVKHDKRVEARFR